MDSTPNQSSSNGSPYAKKIFAAIAVAALFVTAGVVLTSFESDSQDVVDMMRENISIDAIYYGTQNKVVITYNDLTGAHTPVFVEVLGLAESYRESFEGPQFETAIGFASAPKYGWSIHPIIVDVLDHPEFGSIQLKTEVHQPGEPEPRTIYVKNPD